MKFKALGLAGVGISLLAVPALAHHSFAMFDTTQTVEFSGTVKEFQWTNPHSWLVVDVTSEQGEVVEWRLETGSPGRLGRMGWRPRMVVPGDEVSVTVHPRWHGSPGGMLLTVVLPDGTTMSD